MIKYLSEKSGNHFFIFKNLRFLNIKKWTHPIFRIGTQEFRNQRGNQSCRKL